LFFFQELQKEERKYARTIAAMKEKLGKSGNVSVRIVEKTSETIDSAIGWTIENGELWMETRADYWGKHLQSYSANKMSKILNTYSFVKNNNMEHKYDSFAAKALPNKKWKISAGQLDGLNQKGNGLDKTCSQAILDALMVIKEKTRIKFQFDVSAHCDVPVMMCVCEGKELDVQNGKILVNNCQVVLTCLATKIKASTVGAKFISENFKPGAAIRLTHVDGYHEDLKFEDLAAKGHYYCTRYDNGDLVVCIKKVTIVSDIGWDIDYLKLDS